MKLKTHKEMKIAALAEPGTSVENETGSWRTFRPIPEKSKCINCLTCYNVCPENAIKIKNNKIDYIDYKFCKGCLICVRECPAHVIRAEKEGQ